LEEVYELKHKYSRIVQLFRQSGPSLTKLRAAQIQNGSKELVLIDDNDTRWYGFLNMIQRIYGLKKDLTVAFELIKNDKLINTKVENLKEEEYAEIKILIMANL
jgi:hypothetical protein